VGERPADELRRGIPVDAVRSQGSAGEYEPDPAGPQAMTWLLTTVPDIS
jgi:hypothetical protein